MNTKVGHPVNGALLVLQSQGSPQNKSTMVGQWWDMAVQWWNIVVILSHHCRAYIGKVALHETGEFQGEFSEKKNFESNFRKTFFLQHHKNVPHHCLLNFVEKSSKCIEKA